MRPESAVDLSRGRCYVVYLHHSNYERWRYQARKGNYRCRLALDLPPAEYRAEWIEPATLRVIAADTFTHRGGTATLQTPTHAVDIALQLRALR